VFDIQEDVNLIHKCFGLEAFFKFLDRARSLVIKIVMGSNVKHSEIKL
jgi:hypothetical protein